MSSAFCGEIKVHGRMSHPNIVSFYTATEIDGDTGDNR